MQNHWMNFLFRRRFFVLFGTILLIGAGILSLSRLKLEAYPDISDLQVTVITLRPGHSPEEVEQKVTLPIERSLNNLPHVIGRRSRTIFGLSVVDITFAHGTDENLARRLVLEKIGEAELPEGAEAGLAPPTTPAGELYRYVLESENQDELKFRELQDWVIAPRILQVPGVGDVFPFGGLVKQFQILVDPMALYKYNLSIGQIAEAVRANNQDGGGSLLPSGQQAMVVRGIGLIRSLADIENVLITAARGVPVFVRDIGRVKIGATPPTGIFGLNEKTGGVQGVVVMRRGENPSEVLQGVRAAVEELNDYGLPRGVRITPIYDRTELVNNTLYTVSRTLTEGLVVVFLVLLFFLGSLRAALLTAITIPLSLLFAFLGMYWYRIPASLLSLGAIDFGIIVDGTLLMVEYVLRKTSETDADGRREHHVDSIQEAAARIQRPILFSMLILIAAYLPLFTLDRVEGRLFTPMAFTICATLVGSSILTLTLVPVLFSYLFPKGGKPWTNPVTAWLTGRYERILSLLLGRHLQVLSVTVIILMATLGLGMHLGTEFLPQLDEGVVWIRANLPPGISLEKSAEIGSQIRSSLKVFPEIRLVTSQTGRQESNTEPFGPNRNEFLVALNPYATWPDGKRKSDLVEELSSRLRDRFPGVIFNFTQPIIDMVMESITGSSADFAAILSGPDLVALRKHSQQILEVVRRIPGATDAAIEQEADQPQLHIHIDRQESARHGLHIADVQEIIEMAIGGKAVSTIFEGDRSFDLTVRYLPEARSHLSDIGNILIPSPDGARLPLSRLARIEVMDGASIITRKDNRRQIGVRCNIRNRDQGGFAAEAQSLIAKNITLPPGYRLDWGGQFENLDRARHRLVWILPLTILIIFALLYWTFGSYSHALLVLITVPLSIVGGVAALYLRNIPFSVSAAVGFISLFGVAVMNGVFFVTEFQRQRRHYHRPLDQAVLKGASVEFRPLLLLITVAVLGMLPATLATGIGSDVQRPLATVVVGGLLSTLLLTLFVLPCLYFLVEKHHQRRKRNPTEQDNLP